MLLVFLYLEKYVRKNGRDVDISVHVQALSSDSFLNVREETGTNSEKTV